MTDSEAKLIESMADDYSNVLKEAKSMGCKEIRALYNIPIKNMEMIVQALEKQISKNRDNYSCPICSHYFEDYIDEIADKIKVTSLEVIVTGSKRKPYYEIKYKEVGADHYNIGYSSYNLDFVLDWKEKCFELVKVVE